MWFRYSLRKMPKLFANSRPISDAIFCGVKSGSALFANYPFGALKTKSGYAWKTVNKNTYINILMDFNFHHII